LLEGAPANNALVQAVFDASLATPGAETTNALSPLAPEAVASAAASDAASDAAASAASAQGEPINQREEISWLLLVRAFSVLPTHVRSGRLVRQYGDKLLGFMNAQADQAQGAAALRGTQACTAQSPLAGMEQRRRAVRNLLIGVVFAYALAAATVMWAHLNTPAHTPLGAVWFVVSFFMFAALNAPVVLLRVSASNFRHLFWSWFAPMTWGTVAMQMALGAHKPDEPLGTTFELLLLREHGALARTVFLFSQRTDRAAVRGAGPGP
jgi:hypothetical protein